MIPRHALTWPALERAAQQAGWKRNGRTWRGAPCPSCGGGTRDTAWVGPGTTAAFVAGCNAGCDGLAIARALLPDSNPSPVVWREPRTRAARTPTPTSQGQPSPELPAAAWRAAQPVDDTPGAAYLVTRRGGWPTGKRFPASVRWLPGDVAREVGITPRLPRGAWGVIVYRFGVPGEADTFAAQLEAVDAHGVRVKFYPWRPEKRRAKRVGVDGSFFARGRRVFLARAGGPGVALCESVLDALAVASSPWGAPSGEAVIAGAGTSGLQTAAVANWPGAVTIWTHGDGPGYRAALRLRLALEAAGRAVKTHTAPQGLDWADVAQQDHDERAAIQKQDG